MDHIGGILQKALNKRGLAGHALASRICFIAFEYLKENLEELSNEIKIEKFNDGVLTIATGNSIAAQECHSIHHSLIEHINAICPESCLREVRIIRNMENN